MGDRGAILVLPTSTAGQVGPVAAWMSAAGWASAVKRVLGEVWLTTTDGVLDMRDVSRRGSLPALAAAPTAPWHRRVPTPFKTAAKDVRQWQRARRFTVDPDGPWRGHDLAFVWQRHEQFHTAGIRLAHTLGLPSVLFVPATIVWEAEQWGVHRRGWGAGIERFGEQPALRGADVVACGSEIVAEQVIRLGASAERILVTPTGVDLDLFGAEAAPGATEQLRRRLGIDGRFVVGWVGSFRPFHALDTALDAVSKIDGAAVLLVGDGPERARVEARARTLGVEVVTTGTVPHSELPAYLAAMDVALVLAAPGRTFHYSPLKLAEYLAAGRPVIAPDVPQISERLRDGTNVMLIPPGDANALVDALTRLRDDDALRTAMAASARAVATDWSWDRQVERILTKLG